MFPAGCPLQPTQASCAEYCSLLQVHLGPLLSPSLLGSHPHPRLPTPFAAAASHLVSQPRSPSQRLRHSDCPHLSLIQPVTTLHRPTPRDSRTSVSPPRKNQPSPH